MALEVYTAQIGRYAGEDRLDVTRKSAGPDGLPFAPSWALLGPAIRQRRKNGGVHTPAEWAAYRERFLAEMRESYKTQRAAWEKLLGREVVTLLCYCRSHTRCHRTILAAEILPRLGAVYMGEREERTNAEAQAPEE